MRLVLAVALVFLLGGCVLKRTPKTVAAANTVTPKPMPAAPAPPPPSPEPLSIPQTNVTLPAPQPLTAEAQASAQLPEEAASPSPASSRKPRKPGGTSGATNRSEPPRTEAAKPEAAKPEAAKPEPAGPAAPAPAPQIRALVSPEEEQQYKQRADETRRETAQRINHLRGQNLTEINNFLKQSQDAEKRGDMRAAYEFADKALTLVKVLTGGK